MLIPKSPAFDDGQNTKLSGLTNNFTCSDQIINHLIRSLIIEPLLSLIYYHHPVRYLRSLYHPFVDPLRG